MSMEVWMYGCTAATRKGRAREGKYDGGFILTDRPTGGGGF